MGKCIVMGSAPTALRPRKDEGDLYIAADGGLAQTGSSVPDLIVGDFDSLGYVPEGANVVRHPVRKYDSDMMLAARLGIKRGYKRFFFYGGLGGRTDHTISNIQTLSWLTDQGAEGTLVGDEERFTVLKGPSSAAFSPESRGIISVFALDGDAEGVKIENLDYSWDGNLTPVCPLALSNDFVGKRGIVAVRRGKILIIYTKNAMREE